MDGNNHAKEDTYGRQQPPLTGCGGSSYASCELNINFLAGSTERMDNVRLLVGPKKAR